MRVYNTRRQQRVIPRSAPTQSKRSARSRLPFLVTLAVVTVAFLLINYVINTRVSSIAREQTINEKRVKDEIAATKAKAAKTRIDRAKQAEAEARANTFDPNKYWPVSSEPSDCKTTDLTSLQIVINKQYCIVPNNWQPSNLVQLGNIRLQRPASEALSRMLADMKATDLAIETVSGFRSYGEQQQLYTDGGETPDSQMHVDAVSARPGHSEHQTGLSIDFKAGDDCVLTCFGTTRRYAWLQQNAHTYGFIERYPAEVGEITGYIHEPWHWRYVGTRVATEMKQQGITTLEMYLGVRGGDYAN